MSAAVAHESTWHVWESNAEHKGPRSEMTIIIVKVWLSLIVSVRNFFGFIAGLMMLKTEILSGIRAEASSSGS